MEKYNNMVCRAYIHYAGRNMCAILGYVFVFALMTNTLMSLTDAERDDIRRQERLRRQRQEDYNRRNRLEEERQREEEKQRIRQEQIQKQRREEMVSGI